VKDLIEMNVAKCNLNSKCPLYDRVVYLEEMLRRHCNSLDGMEFKRNQTLLSEDLNLIVDIHRIDDPLPENRLVERDSISFSAFPLPKRPSEKTKAAAIKRSRYDLIKK
jgi:hypothetical protein